MQSYTKDLLFQRQRQWEAFHRWESAAPVDPLSIAARVEWYSSAFNLFRSVHPHDDLAGLDQRVTQVRERHEKLRHLTRKCRDG